MHQLQQVYLCTKFADKEVQYKPNQRHQTIILPITIQVATLYPIKLHIVSEELYQIEASAFYLNVIESGFTIVEIDQQARLFGKQSQYTQINIVAFEPTQNGRIKLEICYFEKRKQKHSGYTLDICFECSPDGRIYSSEMMKHVKL